MAAAVKKRIARQKSSRGTRNELQRYLDSDLEEEMVDPVRWWGVSLFTTLPRWNSILTDPYSIILQNIPFFLDSHAII